MQNRCDSASIVLCHPQGVQFVDNAYLGFRCAPPQAKICHPFGISSPSRFRYAASQAKLCHPCGIMTASEFDHKGFRYAASQAKLCHPCGIMTASEFDHKGFRCAASQAKLCHTCGILAADEASQRRYNLAWGGALAEPQECHTPNRKPRRGDIDKNVQNNRNKVHTIQTEIQAKGDNMKRLTTFITLMICIVGWGTLRANVPPTVTNVSAIQRTDGSKLVDIWYSVNDAEGDTLTISLAISNDNGASFSINPSPANLSGAVGENILSGANKHVIWNAGAEGIAFNGNQYKVKVIATEKLNLSLGLVAYYPFNGNANDESGNGNNGTLYGATLTSDRFGNLNKAYWFGGNAYIQVQDNDSLRPDQMSICSWINFETGGTDNPRFVSKESDYPNRGYGLLTMGTSSNREMRSYYNINGLTYSCGSTSSLNQSEWHFICSTYNGSSFNLYVDGSLNNSISVTGAVTHSNIDLFIGRISRSWNDLFLGKIDDVRIYNRALTAQEIQTLFHEGGWPLTKQDNPNSGEE